VEELRLVGGWARAWQKNVAGGERERKRSAGQEGRDWVDLFGEGEEGQGVDRGESGGEGKAVPEKLPAGDLKRRESPLRGVVEEVEELRRSVDGRLRRL
jgi:hypothetical protein